jgi:hypothetical protein
MKKIIHTEKWRDGNKDYIIVVYDDLTTSTYAFVRSSEKASGDLSEAIASAKKSILGHRGLVG